MIQTPFHVSRATFRCGREHVFQTTQQFLSVQVCIIMRPCIWSSYIFIQLGILLKYLILVTMIHWCEQNLTKITILYSFPISETMLLSIKIELRTTNKRVMNINLFYFSSCIPLSKNWRIMCCSSIYHHDSTYSLSHRKQVLI